ncbi:LRR receptor-like kinase family protein [Melia azedarach]|uniref:LRR receptor-like kinase family protein n=1 Tax=Melia azedarach TaxID=155640 RepID=A0ACC1WXP7_MELAZ|nr:LRR receptor-like kinase family protein [Melia azedarach]
MAANTCFSSSHVMTFRILLLFFCLSSVLDIIKLCLAEGNTGVLCLDAEREALFTFKKSLTDPSGRLSSWVDEDCCKWNGIQCNNQTGRVIKLDLRNPFQLNNGGVGDSTAYKRSCLGGKINTSLLYLEYLNHLDLSFNDFEGAQIPYFFGQFKNLKYLNLSFASFAGDIPPQLGNLSSLHYLDLYADSYSSTGTGELRSENLSWLSGLSSLKHLNLGFVKLDGVGADWLQAINMLPALEELRLHWCQLQGIPLSIPFINFTSLSILDLSESSFNSVIPPWLFNLTALTNLYLRWNFFTGHIPSEFENLKLLQVLDLSNNLDLGGQIPRLFGNLSKLKILDLSADNLNGEIQEFLGGFSGRPNNLVFLDLSSNSLEGELPMSLGNLKNLQYLYLSGNSFWGSIPSSIGNLLSLKKLDLSYNMMNGTFPDSFGKLSELVDANLIQNSWEGTLQEPHLRNLGRLENFRLTTEPTKYFAFNVSCNWVPPFRLKSIQLENCLVGPFFPVWLQIQSELTSVILRKVGISDTIPGDWFSKLSSQITYLVLSNNQIKGKLPSQLESPNLRVIDLSSNNFEGPLPLWSTNANELFLQDNSFSGPLPENMASLMPRLQKLFLSRNNLNGRIPSSICNLEELQILSLQSNKLSGEIPDCWYHSQMFWGIDMSNNTLTGNIPSSFGSLRSLSVLMLRDNDLHGEIPSALQNCTGLTSIDLGGNKLSGSLPLWMAENLSSFFLLRLRSNLLTGNIPQHLCNLQNLHLLDLSHNKFAGVIPKCIGKLSALVYGNSSEVFQQLIWMVIKGKEPEYSSIVADVNGIDLSFNNLTGEIPDEIANLSALRILNLSHNYLSGAIPESLSSLTSLMQLNLSYNNLAGKIPSLPKFNDPSIYEGNPLLCGAPLPTKCPGKRHSPIHQILAVPEQKSHNKEAIHQILAVPEQKSHNKEGKFRRSNTIKTRCSPQQSCRRSTSLIRF